jgi:hypothetical protein
MDNSDVTRNISKPESDSTGEGQSRVSGIMALAVYRQAICREAAVTMVFSI